MQTIKNLEPSSLIYCLVSFLGHTCFGCGVGVGVVELVLDDSSMEELELVGLLLVVLSKTLDDMELNGSSDVVLETCSELVVLDHSSMEVLELVGSSLVVLSKVLDGGELNDSRELNDSCDVVLRTSSELVELVGSSMRVLDLVRSSLVVLSETRSDVELEGSSDVVLGYCSELVDLFRPVELDDSLSEVLELIGS